MNVAMIYPAHVSVIEKTAALFGKLDVLMVPHPPGDSGAHSKLEGKRGRLLAEGPELGFETTWIPLADADLDSYDVVIDTWEGRYWEPTWREMSRSLDAPRIIKISWYTPDTIPLEPQDREMFARSVVSTDSIVAADYWRNTGVDGAHFLPWFPGDWWFEQEWSGKDNRALFVLAGAYKWRGGPESQPRLRDFLSLDLVPRFHLDAADRYRSQLELAQEMATFRCYLNLDCAESSRHLSLSFTEALAAGIPCLVIDQPRHDYRVHIRHGVSGYICKDLADLTERASALIEYHDLAVRMSYATKALARERFGRNVVMAEWERAIEHAQHLHRSKA